MDPYLYGGDLFCNFVFAVWVVVSVHLFFWTDFTRYSSLTPASFREYWPCMGIPEPHASGVRSRIGVRGMFLPE